MKRTEATRTVEMTSLVFLDKGRRLRPNVPGMNLSLLEADVPLPNLQYPLRGISKLGTNFATCGIRWILVRWSTTFEHALLGDARGLGRHVAMAPVVDALAGLRVGAGRQIGGPVWRYPKTVRNEPAHAYSDERHVELRAAFTEELTHLSELAYATT
jgi:hypothetical protein